MTSVLSFLELFPDKGNPIEIKEKYRLLTQPKNKSNVDCTPNIDNPDELILSSTTRDQTLHSFHTLFCRRCYKYDCFMHKYKQPGPKNNCSTNELSTTKTDFLKINEKLCSNECYKIRLMNEYMKFNHANNTIKIDDVKMKTVNKRYSNESNRVNKKCNNSESNENNLSGMSDDCSNNNNEEFNLIFKIIDDNLIYLSAIEETLFKVYSRIFNHNSCALSKILRTRTCFQIWNYTCKFEFDISNDDAMKKILLSNFSVHLNHNSLINETKIFATSPLKNNLSIEISSSSLQNSDQTNYNSNGHSSKKSKKGKKTRVKQSHFLARKLHEEAANSNNNQSLSFNNGDNNHDDHHYDNDPFNEETNPLLRVHNYHPCDHPGFPCNEFCKCVRNGNFCEKFCQCSIDCINRFRGCKCKSQCNSKHCPCYLAVRECDPDLCISCGASNLTTKSLPGCCANVSIQRGLHKHLLLGPSEVAGWGIYLKERVAKNEFIAEYCGEVISQDEADR